MLILGFVSGFPSPQLGDGVMEEDVGIMWFAHFICNMSRLYNLGFWQNVNV